MISTFNQAINMSVSPSSLRRVRIGGNFRQSLYALGDWMPFLEEVTLLVGSSGLLVGIDWPKKLKKITPLKPENCGLHGVCIPPSADLVLTPGFDPGDY